MRFQTIALSAAVALSIVAGGLGLRFAIAHRASTQPDSSPQKTQTDSPTATNRKSPIATSADPQSSNQSSGETQLSAISVSPIPTEPSQPASPDSAQPLAAFNHLPYAEADPARLQPAGTFVRENFERVESLDLEAANAFIIMVEEAKAQGINLMPISGFRTVAQQQELFAKQTERYGSESAAAQLSAPAEFSEHHTGYAIDIGDSDRPETDLDASFADTAAYQWLLNNAYIFGFEQSFLPNNPQGLSFEPWHWRYVQSERAAQIFETAREQDRAATEDSASTTETPQP